MGTKLAPRPPGRSCSRPRILGGQGRCATRRCRPSGRSPAVRPRSRRMCERAGRAGRRHAGGMIPAALRGCYSQRNAAQAVIAAASAIARLTANGAWSRARVPGGGTLSAMNDFDVAVIGGGAARLRPGAGLGPAPGGGGRGGCATQRAGRSHARIPLPATECRRAICWPSGRDEVKGYDGQVDGRPQPRSRTHSQAAHKSPSRSAIFRPARVPLCRARSRP